MILLFLLFRLRAGAVSGLILYCSGAVSGLILHRAAVLSCYVYFTGIL